MLTHRNDPADSADAIVVQDLKIPICENLLICVIDYMAELLKAMALQPALDNRLPE